jgi:arylsulfatase A-like enzyme
MSSRQDGVSDRTEAGDATDETATSHPGAPSFKPARFRPSSAFRRVPGRVTPGKDDIPDTSTPRAPRPLAMVATTLTVGVASGFLELAVLAIQVHGLHRVGLSTLRISRHHLWMIPVAEALTTIGLASLLLAPPAAWVAWRSGRRQPARSPSKAWDWAGAVLGMLLILGPLLAIRGLHAAAALVLALGMGIRSRRAMVRLARTWPRVMTWTGAVATLFLPIYALVQWERVAHAEGRAWAQPANASAAGAPNLLWIVMDTVRADRMSLYGYNRSTTPELARWAEEGITFEMARSTAPWTLPSHMSMFTGLWPFEHGARIDRPYFGPSPTLAEHLGAQGYATAGIVANTGMCNSTYGVGRGFDTYVELLCNHEVSARATWLNSALGYWVLKVGRMIGLRVPDQFPRPGRRPAPEIIADAQRWLGGVGRRNNQGSPDSNRPFFLFLNFMDVHSPYYPLPGTTRQFWTGELPPRRQIIPETGWLALQARDAAPLERRPALQKELDSITQRLSDLYDDCLRGLDAEIGRFLRDLRAAGLLDHTWIVITADHGEHFGEHDLFGHGTSLYNELTHVPLLLIPPLEGHGSSEGRAVAARGRRIGIPVSHRDLARTMTGLLVPEIDNPFPGRSLARHWDANGPDAPDPVLSQVESQHLEGEEVQSDRMFKLDSVIDERHVLIESSRRGPELYHLHEDRAQEHNLAGRPADRARQERLRRTLDALRNRSELGSASD